MASQIAPLTQLVATIAARFSEQRRPLAAMPARPRPRAVHAPAALEDIVGRRIAAIEPEDPRRGRRAFRVFLEAVLLSHLGEQLLNEPRFQQLVQDVEHALYEDPATRGMVEQAIAQLLNQQQQR